jgi:hypothetical protein
MEEGTHGRGHFVAVVLGYLPIHLALDVAAVSLLNVSEAVTLVIFGVNTIAALAMSSALFRALAKWRASS